MIEHFIAVRYDTKYVHIVNKYSEIFANKKKWNKKHSENADTSTCVTFGLELCTGSDPIEIGDLGLKVKVTVTENVS